MPLYSQKEFERMLKKLLSDTNPHLMKSDIGTTVFTFYAADATARGIVASVLQITSVDLELPPRENPRLIFGTSRRGGTLRFEQVRSDTGWWYLNTNGKEVRGTLYR